MNACGFLFAFFKYSKMRRIGLFETVVRFATRSDYIHVAIVPAPNVLLDTEGRIQRVVARDIAFTAFMFLGYDEVCRVFCFMTCFVFLKCDDRKEPPASCETNTTTSLCPWHPSDLLTVAIF